MAGCQEEIFYNVGGETLDQVPITENIQGQASRVFEQPVLAEDFLAHCRGIGSNPNYSVIVRFCEIWLL